MKFIFFDAIVDGEERVEDAHLCQLSYIITDNSLQVETTKNFYFRVEQMTKESAYESEMIPFTFKTLSKNRKFQEFAQEIFEDFKSAEVFVTHDAWYVPSVLEMEMHRIGIHERLFGCGQLESTMRIFRNTIQYQTETTYGTYEFASLDDIAWQLNLDKKYLLKKEHEYFGQTSNRTTATATYQATQVFEVYSNYVFDYIKTRRPYTEYMVLKNDK